MIFLSRLCGNSHRTPNILTQNICFKKIFDLFYDFRDLAIILSEETVHL